MTCRVLLVVPLMAGFVVAPGPPAFALTGVQRVLSVSESTSENKLVHAYCPRGTAAIGGGAMISGAGEPFVHLTKLAPLGPDGFAARAEEFRDHTSLNWELSTWAVCAPPPSGLSYRSVAKPPSSNSVESIADSCDAGTFPIGLGAEITDGDGRVMLRDMHTEYAFGDVLAQATEDRAGYAGIWQLTAHLICSDIPTYKVMGLGNSGHHSPKAAIAPCPDSPHTAVGFLFSGANSVGTVGINDVMNHQVTYGVTAYMFPLGQPADITWRMQSFSICA